MAVTPSCTCKQEYICVECLKCYLHCSCPPLKQGKLVHVNSRAAVEAAAKQVRDLQHAHR